MSRDRSERSRLRGVALDKTCAAPGCRIEGDAAMTLRLVLLLSTFGALLSLLGFRRVYRTAARLTERRLRRGSPPADAGESRRDAEEYNGRAPARIAQQVMHVNRHVLPYQSRCLLESLTLWYLLRRRGHDAKMFLGARTTLGPFEAHAWVEHGGDVLNDEANVGQVYAPFDLAAASAVFPRLAGPGAP